MENDQNSELEERLKKAWHEIVTMEERLKSLPAQLDSFSSSFVDIQKTLDASKEQIAGISVHFTDYFAKPDPSVKSKLETVLEHHANIEQFLKAAVEARNDLSDFREFIHGNETLKKIGFKRELETLLENAKISSAALHTDWSSTYKTLYDKIEGLLPGATATGLSKAYQDQKNSYKWPVIMWSAVFGLTVGGMMLFGVKFYDDVENIQDSFKHILARLPFFIPAIWLAIFASKQQSQYKRLQQEYVYKETLAKSYEAYKREIDRLPDSEQKTELLQNLITSMVTMCGYNPSLTLEHKSHEEKPPFSGADILNRFAGAKSAKKPDPVGNK